MLLVLLIAFLAVLGYLLDYFLDRQKHKNLRKWIAILGIILSLVIIGVNHLRQEQQIRDWKANFEYAQKGIDTISTQNTRLLTQYDSLKAAVGIMKTDVDSIRKDNRRLTSLLEPFLERARLSYPGFEDQAALRKLASDVAKMQPKMIFLEDRTKQWVDHSTNIFHTVYFFRSQYSIGVWDVRIHLVFDKPFVSAKPDIGGAWVEDQGSSMRIAPDSTGLSYAMLHLREGNYIKIEIESRAPIEIISKDLRP